MNLRLPDLDWQVRQAVPACRQLGSHSPGSPGRRIDRSDGWPYIGGTGDEPDNRELEKRIELLMKDFEVMQANVNSTLNEMRAEMANRDAARLERDATARWWQTTIIIGAVAIALGVAVLAFG